MMSFRPKLGGIQEVRKLEQGAKFGDPEIRSLDAGKNPGEHSGNYGRYFGVCFSYHNSKACRCGACPSYPADGIRMFCSRGRSRLSGKEAGCLCPDCELYKKFSFEGSYFCRGTESFPGNFSLNRT